MVRAGARARGIMLDSFAHHTRTGDIWTPSRSIIVHACANYLTAAERRTSYCSWAPAHRSQRRANPSPLGKA